MNGDLMPTHISRKRLALRELLMAKVGCTTWQEVYAKAKANGKWPNPRRERKPISDLTRAKMAAAARRRWERKTA